jgi:fructose-1-phosphate kinase PfkB-like protein
MLFTLWVQVDVQDTVGCGDSFAAAIVLGYIRSHDIPATLVLANAVGAATAMGRGAGTNVASAHTVSPGASTSKLYAESLTVIRWRGG